MRYFAMIQGERRGPFELGELASAGVLPDTYVWCKGMADWEKAEDVADICRYFRQTLFDAMHPSASTPQMPGQQDTSRNGGVSDSEDPYGEVPLRFRNMVRNSGQAPPEMNDDFIDNNRPPFPTLLPALLLMFFCFPITGMVAVYYAYRARQSWAEAVRSQSRNSKHLYSDDERNSLRTQAHDYDRQAKMWMGITFFLGIIMFAFVSHKVF